MSHFLMSVSVSYSFSFSQNKLGKEVKKERDGRQKILTIREDRSSP